MEAKKKKKFGRGLLRKFKVNDKVRITIAKQDEQIELKSELNCASKSLFFFLPLLLLRFVIVPDTFNEFRVTTTK